MSRYSRKSQLSVTNCGFLLKFIVLQILLGLFICSCGEQSDDNIPLLSPTEYYDLGIPETSDLCFGSSTDILYTVSDNTTKVYKITTKGRKLSELAYTGNDLEGVCYVDGQYIYVAEERLRKIVKLDLQGNVLDQKTIPVEVNSENEGLEGISYATFCSRFYIINEMNPELLIETDKNLNVLNEYPLTFANDYSGICVDNINQNLWILSDMSATVNKCTMQGELIESYRIPVSNPEGIAYDPSSKILYVVSDSEARLYVFNLNT
ncbi:MAG: SdiA-regulated domain-containing protein [Bacteroidales bacterium]